MGNLMKEDKGLDLMGQVLDHTDVTGSGLFTV